MLGNTFSKVPGIETENKIANEIKQQRRLLVEKGGSVSGFGKVKGKDKRLVDVKVQHVLTTKEKNEDSQFSTSNFQNIANTLTLLGLNTGAYCYISAVKSYHASATVHEKQSIDLKTPGVFIIAGEASFAQSDRSYATTDFLLLEAQGPYQAAAMLVLAQQATQDTGSEKTVEVPADTVVVKAEQRELEVSDNNLEVAEVVYKLAEQEQLFSELLDSEFSQFNQSQLFDFQKDLRQELQTLMSN